MLGSAGSHINGSVWRDEEGTLNPERMEWLRSEKDDSAIGVGPDEFPGSMAMDSNPGDLVVFNHKVPSCRAPLRVEPEPPWGPSC